MRKLVLLLVSLLWAAENAAAQAVPDIGQKKPQLSLTETVKNIDRGEPEEETKVEEEDDKGIFSFMNFSFSKKKESKKVYARPDEKKESFVQRITRQAEEGDVNAQLTLGYMYLYGEEGVEIDYNKAFRYYSMAAAQNDSVAVNNLGSLYYSGIGTEKDYLKAATLFDRAAKPPLSVDCYQLFVDCIRGYGLECEWKGDIRLRGPLTRPGVTGGMQAVRGTLDILGRRFKLSEGEITFDGGWPVSPVLNVVMAYSSSDVTADITLSGTASRPEILLSSEPELPKDEILSRIMFGKEANSLSHVQALQLAAGAAELAGFGGGGVMDLGRRIFGLDVLKFNSDNDGTNDSDTSRTSLEMGTYVRDNVYVGVEQGLGKESETDAVVEIELFPGVEAQAKTSSTRTEVGLEWKKNY